MIGGKRVLGLIPARGGSKGLPRKNVLPLAGKPLIAWTIESALASRYLDRIVLSSDDDEIMQVARSYGCEVPFRRPADLATDETPGIEPVLHALDQLERFDYVVLLQPTSPLRTAEDIDGAMEKCVREQFPSCVSIVEADKPPEWMFSLGEGNRLVSLWSSAEPVARRQDAAPVYVLNGAVYVADADILRRTRRLVTEDTAGYVMPAERSIDVDTEMDLYRCELLLGGRGEPQGEAIIEGGRHV